MAGYRPRFELTNGIITLRSTDCWLSSMTNSHFRSWVPPASLVRFAVGPAPELVLEAGDLLRLSRRGTGDLALSIRKGGNLQIAFGAVRIGHLSPEISVEEDPRAKETSLFSVIWSLDQSDTTLIWMNVADMDLEATLRDIQNAPPGRVVIAIAGENADERRQMNHRLAGRHGPLPPGRSSFRYVDVDARFQTREEWLQYLRSLPTTRPDDLWLRIRIGETCTQVREGEYAFVSPWHLFVRRVYEPGLPGNLSQLAIARSHPSITERVLIEAANAIALRGIDIRH